MGSVIIVDYWLVDMAQGGQARGRLASTLLTCQLEVQRKYGHILDLHSEYPRSQLSAAAKTGILPRVVVRCMRCQHKAWLPDWVLAGLVGPNSNKMLQEHYGRVWQGSYLAYLRPCEGETNVEGIEALCDSYARWEG